MCGITGVIVKKNEYYASNVYRNLLLASQIRGQDGTGITRLRDSEFLTKKWDSKASDIVFSDDFNEVLDLKAGDKVVGQNRYATFGLEHSNDQPLVTNRFALVHNGVLYDYEKQFEKYNVRRELKVDTELILRLIERCYTSYYANESIKDIMTYFEGEAACLLLVKPFIKDYQEPSMIAFMKNKILYSGEDQFGNIYFFSTLYIKNKVPQICKNIYEFKNYDVIEY